MSANQTVKIADLSPSSKKDLTLVFEVNEVLDRPQAEGKEAVLCRVVDETGIITAYFDQYAAKFTVGTVFEIQNFKCRVVDHHLRLEMMYLSLNAEKLRSSPSSLLRWDLRIFRMTSVPSST